VIASILAFALIAAAGIPKAFENVFAQEGFTTEDLVNETITFGNDTTTMMNTTLAFAQEDDTGMPSDSEEDMRAMNQSQEGNDIGMVQGQSNGAKNDDVNNEKEEEEEEESDNE
jgi:hypothetical protein